MASSCAMADVKFISYFNPYTPQEFASTIAPPPPPHYAITLKEKAVGVKQGGITG
jgi:hypothetical protein